jgi:host factor-I protein
VRVAANPHNGPGVTRAKETLYARRRSLMSQVTEPRASLTAQPSIQDVFLNQVRRNRAIVTIHLMDGRYFEARIKNFDKFVVIFDVDGKDHMAFKHAIATIETSLT